jgi:retron-type reverse transcriptase
MLTYLNVVFQALYEPTEAAMGFVPGRSIADNASAHVGKYYVFNTDLKDFFPSIQQPRLWAVLQLKPFSLNKELASVIAGLCCMRDANGDGVLPQGSPCSPILTNIICRKLDRRLTGLAKRFNLKYTRYADDITFSSDYNVFQDDSEFMAEFKRIIADQHFAINDKKTRLQKKNQRQEVTGLVVNEKINVAREYVRDIRNLLYIWKRYGYEHAYAKFFSRHAAAKAYRLKNQGVPSMESVIAGKLLYLRMVMGEDSSAYNKLLGTFKELCPERKKVSDNNLTYEVSYGIDEFDSLFNTQVSFKYKENADVMYGKSKTTALCIIDGCQHQIAVNVRCDSTIDKYLANPDNETLAKIKKRFYISLCLRGEKKFWLITRARMTNEHKTAYQDEYKAKVNPDFSWLDLAAEEFSNP